MGMGECVVCIVCAVRGLDSGLFGSQSAVRLHRCQVRHHCGRYTIDQ